MSRADARAAVEDFKCRMKAASGEKDMLYQSCFALGVIVEALADAIASMPEAEAVLFVARLNCQAEAA